MHEAEAFQTDRQTNQTYPLISALIGPSINILVGKMRKIIPILCVAIRNGLTEIKVSVSPWDTADIQLMEAMTSG
jgi:hypothetical protein